MTDTEYAEKIRVAASQLNKIIEESGLNVELDVVEDVQIGRRRYQFVRPNIMKVL